MATHLLLDGLSGNLQSNESWTRQQSLEFIRHTLTRNFAGLTPGQQHTYVRLQREALLALNAVETANTALINTFKTQGLAQLRSKLGGLDPEAIFLHTRYLEEVSVPLPWEPRTSIATPVSGSRFRRTYDEWKYRPHLSTLSLWEAACLNFDFATQTKQRSGHSFVDSTYLTGVRSDQLDVPRFVAISRELDLGGRLQTLLKAALAPGGTLQALIETSAHACLRFEALEAYRNHASTGITLALYEKLVQAIDGSGPALAFDTVSMDASPYDIATPLPLLLIQVASLGVVSYFPFRPGGALRFHTDARAANAQFLDDLQSSHRSGDLGWFSRQLPMTQMRAFKQLPSEAPRPVGLSDAAEFLYDTFHHWFPERSLGHLRFSIDPKTGPVKSLANAFALRQVQRYHANLSTLATTRSERDLQAVIDAAAAVADEILQLLLTPVPGGVTGLNRIMQVVVFGSLTYSVVVGITEAVQGESSNFAAAMTDVADLAVNSLLISTAGRVHRQRINGLMQSLGNPRKVQRADGEFELWKPDISAYATLDQNLLNGQVANPQGVYQVKGNQYVWLIHAQQRVVVEVHLDPQTGRMALKPHNSGAYAPPIIFDPAQQAWTLDLQNAHTLSDVELTERMLPEGSSPVPRAAMERMLRSTAPSRATLNRIWDGEPAPINLTEGVRRLQVDQLIKQLIHDFHRRGHMPPHADSSVLCLLTQLETWPQDAIIRVHDEAGSHIETYAGNRYTPPIAHTIDLTRRDDGTYFALGDTTIGAASQEQLFELIIARQPGNSTLGKEGSAHLNLAQRIARVRLQISALAKTRQVDLFSAMSRYAGKARDEVPVTDSARDLVAIKVAPPLVELTPVLQKLRDLYPPLTPVNLQQLLLQTPLNPQQQTEFLSHGKLPAPVRQNLEHHRTAVRIDAVIDGLYHPRAFHRDTDLWAREFAASLVRTTLKRHFVVTEMSKGRPADSYVSTGPDDTTVELLHYGAGRYEAYDMLNGGPIPVTPAVDSFYLAIGSVLQPHERLQLGMQSASDAEGLRKTLGDVMSAQRSPDGHISLLNTSLVQYEQRLVLPFNLQPSADGLYNYEGQQLVPLYGSLYPITFDNTLLKWRLKHPEKVGVDTPRLEHNRRGAWRLSSEYPMAWSDYSLFYRLGPLGYDVDQPTAARILRVTDTPARALREVHSANRPPPPLLADTSKRFRIEREIEHFIQAMTTYSATGNARPALQLLLVCALREWPKSHVLQVVDTDGQIIRSFPSANVGAAHTIQMTVRQSRGSAPLTNIAKDDTVTRALLGELPASLEERLFKLARKVAEHAYRERTQLFDSLYAQSENNGTVLQRRFKQHYPDLPGSALDAILEQASPREIKQLHEHDEIGLRLAEQVRLTRNDVRLNRAFEGLYLQSSGNPDSETIILHVLASAAGWPANTRLDIHEGDASGLLLSSAGHLNGTQRKVLAKVDGRYQACDDQGQLISDMGEGLLSAIHQVLGDGELSTLQNAIADAALNQRIAIKALLGIPHVPFWLQPPMQVDTSFSAYPFSLQNLWPFSSQQPVDLLSKVRELHPSLSRAGANDLIAELGMSEPAALLELQRRKAEYQALDYGLTRWAEAPQANDANAPQGVNLDRRRLIAQQIRSAWRRETRQLFDNGLFDTHHLVLQLDGNDLPDADFILGTRGFAHIESLMLTGDAFPATGNAFLSKFANLRFLQVECGLTELPTSITDMTQLEHLTLNDNNIRLTQESRQNLAGMTRLRELHLNDNPLELTPDVSAMTRLRTLSLQGTGISQWPIGAERRPGMQALLLQENQITSVPDVLFTDARMRLTNRVTVLHGNPLSPTTLLRLDEYRQREGIRLGGVLPGIQHAPVAPNEVSQWLAGVSVTAQAERTLLWEQLLANEQVSADDVFQVLRDLPKTHAYRSSIASREALTARVWTLLLAMGESTELRNNVCLKTRGAGQCGDSALLAFTNMELEHRIHRAKEQSRTYDADRALIALSNGCFYLDQLDEITDRFIRSQEAAGLEVDRAEVIIYFRAQLANEFNLPFEPLELLYAAEDVTQDVLDTARSELRRLGQTEALQEWLLMQAFWIEYLARSHPEPFSTVKDAIKHKERQLNEEIPDKRSDEYLERRQSLVDLEQEEQNRLVRQLTVATQAALLHA
ncbi:MULTISPECIES: NEL-type E3 ubiquitin ligase domain-containing protein [unclassified Pseudomonas]|uniref:NEL-type E3 ubiquitin ligase domain-containing protein n=1 Tax=unclassified Pseudomonas TaxID=196821 RepID=UPI001F58916E|nr:MULTISPECIES: NEL-type E3 ubiquitin ligase domain-containing protein [unclassified Pseudomonas]